MATTHQQVGETMTTEHQLRQRLAQLEQTQQRDREVIAVLEKKLASVQTERDRYLKAIYAWSRARVSEEELRRWASEDLEGESLDQVIAELTVSKLP